MFGMGGSEILVILVIALLFLGPDKLPQAAKQISKGIRDIKKQSRSLQQQIENDENIGGAIRDLKSALRGDELPSERAKAKKKGPKVPKALPEGTPGIGDAAVAAAIAGATPDRAALPEGEPVAAASTDAVEADADAELPEAATEAALENAAPRVTLPPVAGEPDPDVATGDGDDDVGELIRPAAGTVAKGSEPKHG